MTIPWTTNPGGLFRRIGAIGQVLSDLYTLNVTTVPTDATAIENQYAGSGISNAEPDLVASLFTYTDATRLGALSSTSPLAGIAAATIERMVYRDNPQASRTSLALNLQEVIRQMRVNSQTVKACTVTIATGTVSGITNSGNGFIVTSTKRGDGLVEENMYAETGTLVCTSDAQTGGAQKGNEKWRFRGDESQPNVFHWEWPLGSGASTSFASCAPTASNSLGNLLVNSGFDTFTTNTPNNWTIATGAAGTEVFAEASVVYSGAKALKLVGGTAVNTSLTQQFNLSTQSPATLHPETPYAHLLLIKADVVPASGVLTVDLIDNNGTTIQDDQGVNNSYAITLSGITTSYAAYSGTFRLPRVLPASVRVRYRLSTVLPGGSNVYIDHTALTPHTQIYAGGPNLALFGGSIPWIEGDTFSFTTTNDRGGASSLATFQTLFDRFFNMRSLGLLLPSAGSPTISDSLI